MGLPARVTPRRRDDFVLVKESACRRSWRCRDLFVHDDVVRAVRPGYMFTCVISELPSEIVACRKNVEERCKKRGVKGVKVCSEACARVDRKPYP